MLWRLPRWVRERIERNLERRDILYPWWVPMTCFVGQTLAVVLALAQRDALWPVQPMTVTVVLVLISPVVHFGFGGWLPWWIDSAATIVAAGVLMASPVDSGIDLAPALLALIAAEAVARDGLRPGAAVATVATGVIIATEITANLDSYGVYLLEVLLGFVVGAMLWWQMRALASEREARGAAWAQATTAERERIAREIHDLVAHSLSVSLLQVTGARRALRDVTDAAGPAETADAVAEVDAALADAEQVGRRAMADIRRTVSALADGPSERNALPCATDIAALVQEVSDAGLRVEYDEQGDPSALTAAAGLGLYRIAQESLANVSKHGSGVARMSFHVTGAGSATLRVLNPLPPGRPRTDGLGSGLAGMEARATQLGATLRTGVADGGWEVVVQMGPERGSRREPWVELPCGRTIGKVSPT
ncbi:histidine kinase [Nocardioides sp. WS12]|uniref:sensor histidine kinase n=1 Tax=Nocardioides sp. WS12 TaxID=2486272 RepID=UPI0015F83153|nr:histidine kinase [Nocardioides sp. WS12]